MSHKIRTVITHRFDLHEAEQFEYTGWRKTAIRVDHVQAVLDDQEGDGPQRLSLTLFGRQVLKSGGLGQVRYDVRLWSTEDMPETLRAALVMRGIKVES